MLAIPLILLDEWVCMVPEIKQAIFELINSIATQYSHWEVNTRGSTMFQQLS
jgi:hypothetical protein